MKDKPIICRHLKLSFYLHTKAYILALQLLCFWSPACK